MMKLAILHWVYKDIPLCVNRARWLRRLNPGTPIHCLYGGPMEDAAAFAAALRPVVDDFYAYEEPVSAHEKWLHADRLIAAWHRDRGCRLDWDMIFLAQWDLALLAPIASLCGSLGPDQVLFSGTRRIAAVRHFWSWLRPGSVHEADYEAFRQHLGAAGAFPTDPLCCNLVAAALPKAYLDRYVAEAPRIGFSEYKMPILAQSWGFGFCVDHKLDPQWVGERILSRREQYFAVLHAESDIRVRPKVLALNACLPRGHRAFHPFVEPVPLWLGALPTMAASNARRYRQLVPVTTSRSAAR